MVEETVVQELEPEFIRVGENEIEVVKPTVRFPQGCYVRIGETFGIQFPALAWGQKGQKMRNALAKVTKLFTAAADVLKTANVEQSAIDGTLQMMNDNEDTIIEFYREGLLRNYDAKTAQWIIDNFVVDWIVLGKLISTAQGDVVDADSFRGKPRKV